MSRHRRDLMPASQMIARAMRRAGPGSEPALGAVRKAWSSAVGDAVAVAAQPVRRTRNGVLTIACADASWAAELRSRSDDLMRLLCDALPPEEGRVAGLRFVVADRPPDDRPTTGARTRPRRPTAQESERARILVGDVSDPDLRDTLTRAAAAVLASQRKGRKLPGNSG